MSARSPILDFAAHNPVPDYIPPVDDDAGGLPIMTELSTNILTEDSETILTD